MKRLLICAGMVIAGAAVLSAQNPPASPPETASATIGGKNITISYNSPRVKGREGHIFTKDGLISHNPHYPIWRAGADVSTRINTEVPLVIDGKTLPAGEYSLFIDLKENHWTFVVSNWAALPKYDPKNKEGLWGSYFYTPDKDVLRVPMKLENERHSVEELTWEFLDMTPTGGLIALSWDKTLATIAFRAAP